MILINVVKVLKVILKLHQNNFLLKAILIFNSNKTLLLLNFIKLFKVFHNNMIKLNMNMIKELNLNYFK